MKLFFVVTLCLIVLKQIKAGGNTEVSFVQAGGHHGAFIPLPGEILLKKYTPEEHNACQAIALDPDLMDCVPYYYGKHTVTPAENKKHAGEVFMKFQNVMTRFAGDEVDIIVMDIKLGITSFKEIPEDNKDILNIEDINTYSEVKSGEYWGKLLEKVGVLIKESKLNFKDKMLTTTSELGFRIEGFTMLKANGEEKKLDFSSRSETSALKAIKAFVGEYPTVAGAFLKKLKELKMKLKTSRFFNNYDIVGSSLLFVHNKGLPETDSAEPLHTKGPVWMVDFAKTTLETSLNKTEAAANRAGYLLGIKRLIKIFKAVVPQET